MATVARLRQDGELLVAGDVDTRKPTIENNIALSLPFDGSTDKSSHLLSQAKVLGFYGTATTHSVYDYINANSASMTLSADILAEDPATVAANYDLVVVDMWVWAVSSAIVDHLKLIVDAGCSCVAVGNDTRTNYFVATYSGVQAAHTISMDPYGRLDPSTGYVYPSGSTDLIGGIDSLQNGAIPEYYRDNTGQITGWSYTSPTSGAVLFFDLEGITAAAEHMLEGYRVCLENSKGRQTASNLISNHNGLAMGSANTNLYADGDFEVTALHPVRNGPWSLETNHRSPNGRKCARVDADGTTSYNGRDITTVIGTRYTSSAWIYVSPDADTTSVQIRGEQGFTGFHAVYDISKKGTWQYVTATGAATTTNCRILMYQISNMTQGFVLFSEIQFEAKKFATPFHVTGHSQPSFRQNFQPMNPCTIVGKFKPTRGWEDSPSAGVADYTTTVDNQSSLIGVHDSVNGSNAYFRYYQTATGPSVPFLDPDGTWGTAHIHATYTTTDDELYYYVQLNGNNLRMRIYQNGSWKSVHSFTASGSPVLDGLSFGTTTVWAGWHENVSVYNSVVSETDIVKMINQSHKVTSYGIQTKKIETKPMTPVDASFFDLGANGGDGVLNTIIPTADSTNYTSGDAYVGGANGKLQYNLNASIGLDWSGDWSLCYMKKPIGTATGEASLTGYNIESLGCNSNSVGGGYVWWGKNNAADSLSGTTNASITPSVYFNNWQYITMVKSGTTVTIQTWLVDKLVRTRTFSLGAVVANYYVTQYGYDLYLGGWDNNGGCYNHFKNFVVAKRALTAAELDNYRLNKIKSMKDVININTNVQTRVTL